MKFQVSEKIRSHRAKEDLLVEIERKLKAIANKVVRDKQGNLVATDIEASFGSINRNSSVTLSMRKSDDGWFMVGDVVYKPSKMFWVFIILGLCIPPLCCGGSCLLPFISGTRAPFARRSKHASST